MSDYGQTDNNIKERAREIWVESGREDGSGKIFKRLQAEGKYVNRRTINTWMNVWKAEDRAFLPLPPPSPSKEPLSRYAIPVYDPDEPCSACGAGGKQPSPMEILQRQVRELFAIANNPETPYSAKVNALKTVTGIVNEMRWLTESGNQAVDPGSLFTVKMVKE